MEWILLIILLVVFIIIIIDYFMNQNRNIHDSFLGIGILFLTSSFIDMFDIVKVFIDISTSALKDSSIYFDKEVNYIFIIIGVILITIGLVLKYRKTEKLLNIYSYSEKNPIIKGFSNVEEIPIDAIGLYESVPKNKCCYKLLLDDFVRRIEKYSTSNIYNKTSYTGIVSIPFAMLAGTCLKNVKFDNFYEYYKDNYFHKKLNSKNTFPQLQTKGNITNQKELLIAVGITNIIKEEDIKQFNTNDIILKNIKADSRYEDNRIFSKKQLKKYTNEIYSLIKNNANYEKINIVMASQSCLAMELGKLIDDKNDTEIICFQYECGKYTWGITISGKNKGERTIL